MNIDLDELQKAVEELLVLLKDRQPGLLSWNDFMREQLTNVYNLVSQALGQ